MRISDWSSDVCSSDLVVAGRVEHEVEVLGQGRDGGGGVDLGEVVAAQVEVDVRLEGLGAVAHVDRGGDAAVVRLDELGVADAPHPGADQQLGEGVVADRTLRVEVLASRSAEHTSELQSLMR